MSVLVLELKGPWKTGGPLGLLGASPLRPRRPRRPARRTEARVSRSGSARTGVVLDVAGHLHVLEHRAGLGVDLVRQLHGQVARHLVEVAQVALHFGDQLGATQVVGVHVDGAGLLGDGVQRLLLAPHREADDLATLAADDAADALLERSTLSSVSSFIVVVASP